VLHRTLQGQPAGRFVMGHEYAGTVAALGPGVDEFQVGDRVAVEVHKGCDRCENCIKGLVHVLPELRRRLQGATARRASPATAGFAEFAVNHINTLYRLAGQPLLRAGLHGDHRGLASLGDRLDGRLRRGRDGSRAGPGPIGLIAVQLCKALGAARVILTGTRDSRLAIGKELGADHTINIRSENLRERVREITGGRGADCVLECAGGPGSMQEALRERQAGRPHRRGRLVRGPRRGRHEPRRALERAHLRGARKRAA